MTQLDTLKRSGGRERSMAIRTVEKESNSTIKIVNTLSVGTGTVWTILKDYLLYPYHIQHTQVCLYADSFTYCILSMTSALDISISWSTMADLFFTVESNLS